MPYRQFLPPKRQSTHNVRALIYTRFKEGAAKRSPFHVSLGFSIPDWFESSHSYLDSFGGYPECFDIQNKVRIVTFMAMFQNPYEAVVSHDRDGHDGGEAARSSHYFSAGTMRRAMGYRDVSWRRLGLQLLIALPLMSAPLIESLGDLGPFALIAGAALAGITGYVALAKLLDATRTR